jgi:hypothetical protein
MGWQTDDGDHEGWDAAEFPGGLFSVGSMNGGAMTRPLGPGGKMDHSGDPVVVDGRTAIGWRGLCECGWQGPLWQRVATIDEHDLAARRIWAPDLREYGDTPAEVEDAIYHEWRGHLPPRTLGEVREQAGITRHAEDALAKAVALARADGCSWDQIADAAGLLTARQAEDRWGQ